MKFADKIITIVEKNNDSKEMSAFWKNKTPEERIYAVEFLRTQFYVIHGYQNIPRIVKTITIRDFNK